MPSSSPRSRPQGLDALTPAEALVEVADAVFDLLADEDWQTPFVCPEHGFGLHPLLDDGRAVWWCRPPNHVVAEIGRLGVSDELTAEPFGCGGTSLVTLYAAHLWSPMTDGVLVMLQRDAICPLPTRRRLALALAVLMVVGLLGLGASVRPGGRHPDRDRRSPTPTAVSCHGDRSGPDGALWFTTEDGIGRITTNGTVTSYSVGVPVSSPSGSGAITVGPDGALWFTTEDGIGRITTTGVVTPTRSAACSTLSGITSGPDGNLWFTAEDGIGRITTTGVVTTYSVGIPLGGPHQSPRITTGPDGALWFTAFDEIGRITTSVSSPAFPAEAFSSSAGLHRAPTEHCGSPPENGVGQITTTGVVTSYDVGVPDEWTVGIGGYHRRP